MKHDAELGPVVVVCGTVSAFIVLHYLWYPLRIISQGIKITSMRGNASKIDWMPKSMQNWWSVCKEYQQFGHGIMWHQAFPELFQIWSSLGWARSDIYWLVGGEGAWVTMGIWKRYISWKRKRNIGRPFIKVSERCELEPSLGQTSKASGHGLSCNPVYYWDLYCTK